ncbi:MAG: hypothetical protein V3T30_03350, partial [Thermodesulfobacteriota bacterium]
MSTTPDPALVEAVGKAMVKAAKGAGTVPINDPAAIEPLADAAVKAVADPALVKTVADAMVKAVEGAKDIPVNTPAGIKPFATAAVEAIVDAHTMFYHHPVFVLILIMIFAGILGGAISYYMEP